MTGSNKLAEQVADDRWRDERSKPPAPELWVYRDGYHYARVTFTKPDPGRYPTAVRYVFPKDHA